MVNEQKKSGVLEDKLSAYYEDVSYRNYREILNEALFFYDGINFEKILDIGAGVGTLFDAIKPYGFEYYALESSEYGYHRLVEKGAKAKKLYLDKGIKLPFADNFFSCVIFNQVIEHLEKEVGVFYLEEIARVLEPGGVAIIKSPSRYARIFVTDPHHIYCWKPNELLRMVNGLGKDIVPVKMHRVPLEPWMFLNYSDKRIDYWHKYNKRPILRKLFYFLFKALDIILKRVTGSDICLSVSNVSFVKKID